MMEPKDNIEKLIKNKDVQFRDFKKLVIEERQAENGSNELVIEGVACTYDEPTILYSYDGIDYKEQIDSKAFKEADMSDVIFNYNHCGRVYARNRNGSLTLEDKEDGLHMKAILRADDEGHKQLYSDIKSGLIDKMSFAFTIKEQSYDSENHIRTVRKVKRLFDVSAVDIPAYDTTSISARSFFESEREKELKVIEERQKQLDLAKAKYYYFN